MRKRLYDISWQVTEPEYRADSALSYSTIARYDREGFNGLSKLFDKIESPSLTFGSIVDTLLTGTAKEFDDTFFVADFDKLEGKLGQVVDALYAAHKTEHKDISSIPYSAVLSVIQAYSYQPNWKETTRVNVVMEKGSEYYRLKSLAEGKRVITATDLAEATECRQAVLDNPYTAQFFTSNPWDDSIEVEFQLKFRQKTGNVWYRNMADAIRVDHKNKVVYPVDLKTSSHTEWDFYKSFIQWSYSHQARLYWSNIRAAMDADEYFRNFRLDDYRFIVVNKGTLTPLVWKYKDTTAKGTLVYESSDRTITIRDPHVIGAELQHYLDTRPAVPDDITVKGDNDIVSWLVK